jgi:uncharacterized protein (TIGR02231 family)
MQSWRIGFIFLFFLMMADAFVAADNLPVESKIISAVVYPQGARITRSTRVQLKEGTQTITLEGVLPDFDENSMSVSGAGTALAKILGAGIRTVYLQESSDVRVRELQTALQQADDQIEEAKAAASVLAEKKAFLDSLRLFSQGQLPKDLVTKLPTVDELKGTLSFLEQENKLYQEGRIASTVLLRELASKKMVLAQELNQLNSGVRKAERVLAVDVECERAGELKLEIAYTVNNVSWQPIYDARVNFEKAKTVLSAFAVAAQATGEDWNDVALTLSTARPSVGGTMPELSAWYLSPVMPMPSRRKMAKGMMMDAGESTFASSGIAQEMDFDSNKSDKLVEREAAPVYAQSESSGVSLVYKAARPVTIKSDGSETRVPLLSQNFDADFEYAATPKLSPYAYLTTRVTNGSQDQLMSGRVNIFLDGTFVGASAIDRTVSAGESFMLHLGIDEGVEVKRELLEQKTDDTLIGNIPSPTKKVSYAYKFKLENKKARPVRIKVFDHVPVSQDDKIKVSGIRLELKPDTDRYEGRPGVYCWTLTLQPGEKKEFALAYVVEYPRDLIVSGL